MSEDFNQHAFYNVCDFEKDYSTHEHAVMLYLGGNDKEQQLFNPVTDKMLFLFIYRVSSCVFYLI